MVGRMLSRYRVMPSGETPNTDATRYEVVARLTTLDDLDFLRTLPGFRPEMAKKFRKERRRICRLYMREMAADFQRLYAAARAMISLAPEEHSDLIATLFRSKVRFWRSLALVELRLMLGAAGVRSVDLRAVLDALEGMRVAVGQPQVAADPSAA